MKTEQTKHAESGCTDYLQHPWESCPENKPNKAQHSDWHTQQPKGKFETLIWQSTPSVLLATTHGLKHAANAAIIVRAVNHADKLAEACKWLLSLYDEQGEHREQYQDQCSVACEKAEVALKAYEAAQ